jgi:two-component system sensor histidine kinase DesK
MDRHDRTSATDDTETCRADDTKARADDAESCRADGEQARPTDGERAARLGSDLPAPRLARAILLVALLSYTLITMLNIAGTGLSPVAMTAALLALAAIFAIQLSHSAARPGSPLTRRRVLTLSAQALLTYGPIVVFHAAWGSMAGFLAASVLLLLRPRVAWTLYALIGLSMIVPPLLEGRPVVDVVYLPESTLLTGLVIYGLSRLSALIRELVEARGELARMAVTEERLRFARDLHDLLGFSLSAITLKSELIHRLIPGHPARATAEIEDVLAISRQSLSDVRRVASGLREMSLEQEISSAESVLHAADILVTKQVGAVRLAKQADTVLATVLREAVTNLLRHSRAGRCTIEVEERDGVVRLSVFNDGVDPAYHDPSPHGGSGLGNLRDRIESVGGRMESARTDDGTFRLVAEIPSAKHPDPLTARDDSVAVGDSVA